MPRNRILPASVRPYRRTALFDENSVPQGLLGEHRTKPGVWGVIHVESGRLRYSILSSGEEIVLNAGETAVITPDDPHKVAPDGAVTFYVEFWR